MGMSFARAFNTDRDLEENGKWFNDVLGDGSGINLKIRRMSSERVAKFQQEEVQRNRYRMKEGKFPDDVNTEILINVLAGAVIVEWSGVTDNDDREVAFSVEAATDYLTRFRDFRLLVSGLASNMDAYRKGTEEEIQKN